MNKVRYGYIEFSVEFRWLMDQLNSWGSAGYKLCQYQEYHDKAGVLQCNVIMERRL